MILKLLYLQLGFDKILGDIEVVSDYLSIKTTSKSVEFSGKGDSGEAIINLEKDVQKD